MCTIIAIANQKGGVGKTSSAIEIASCLTHLQKKVLLIDFDQQRNCSKYMGCDMTLPNIYSALTADAPVGQTIQHLGKIDMIASSQALSRADRTFIDNDDIYLLSDILGMIKQRYQYIVIDTSPARNVLLTMAYVAADYIVIPTDCDEGSIDGILAINEDVNKLTKGKRKYSEAKIAGIILTKYEGNTVLHQQTLDTLSDIVEQIDPKMFLRVVRKSISASECKKVGLSMQDYDKKGNPASDYRKITRELIKITGGN